MTTSRKFKGPIFFGAGERSGQEAQKLRDLVDDVMVHVGGLQQPDHPESEAQAKAQAKARLLDEKDRETMIVDIVVALGGQHLLRRSLRRKLETK